jgi:exodeoxyribonuclease VII large subunit
MTTPPETPDTAHNLPELSVSDLSQALRRTVEDAFGRVRVRGEISQPKVAGSGHCYLRLKDDQAVLDGVIWRGAMAKLSVRPEEGLEVIATGRLTTYAGRSSYQIIVESLELAGEGALLKMLEERRRRLAAEGLFAPERKRPIPFLPRVVGVVTSPTGAVIRDILHRLNDRCPVHVLVWPVRVQGEEAASEIVAAIKGFNALTPGGSVPRPDVLIVARGGGSLEDLMAFNEESVVRAAADSAIPLVSAVGHETDTTLIDHAADLRAPTPTGAAEMVVPVRLDLLARVSDDGRRLLGAVGRVLEERGARLTGLARGLPDLGRLVEDRTQRLDDRAQRLALAWPTLLERRQAEVDRLFARLRSPREVVTLRDRDLTHLGRALDGAARRAVDDAAARLDGRGRLLESYSFRKVLDRGFVLVRDADDRPVTAAGSAPAGQPVTLQFADGRVGAVIDGGAAGGTGPSGPSSPVGARPAAAPRRARTARGDSRQGNLLDGL